MNNLGGGRYDCLTEDVNLAASPSELGDKFDSIVVVDVNYKLRDLQQCS